MNRWLFVAALVALVSPCVLGKHMEIIDEDGRDVLTIAEAVCDSGKNSELQISQTTTIDNLIDFFLDLPADHKLVSCYKKYGGSLEDLQQLFASANQDVCSDDKLKLIKQYHHRYVSRALKHQEEQEANHWQAPKQIKLLFMHYASRVASICEQSALTVLKGASIKLDSNNKYKEDGDKTLAQISDILGITNLSDNYDNVFLPWSIIDKLPVEKSPKFSRYINSQGSTKLAVAMKSTDRPRAMQTLCAEALRPIYEPSLLPVIRLVDMGYYPEGDSLIEEVNQNAGSKRLFVMAQVCELLRPIQFVADPSLADAQSVVLLRDDARIANFDEQSIHPNDNSNNAFNDVKIVTRDTIETRTIKVKLSTKNRDKAMKLIFKTITNALKNKLKSKLGSLFVDNGHGSLEPAINGHEDSLDEDKFVKLVNANDSEEVGLSRRKRSFTSVARKILEWVLLAIGYVFLFIFGILFFIAVGISEAYCWFYNAWGVGQSASTPVGEGICERPGPLSGDYQDGRPSF